MTTWIGKRLRALKLPADRRRLAAGAGLAVATVAILGLISPPERTINYYVVKLRDSGNCSIVTRRPAGKRHETLWYSRMRRAAAAKLRELRRFRQCD